ncbi:hypothetical protein H8B09_24655 [Paenibacillus sp. PR3]|uniref:Uncharacterized protein n=1 Tax=Paenibacillus terricola TaxID=2763503 RepID=A0ABR8N364_9BACL|nr:hypothetical protein [Paenibacillus terricola]MBD3921976.1 hypothetical protein [Paenibacillus terricola]
MIRVRGGMAVFTIMIILTLVLQACSEVTTVDDKTPDITDKQESVTHNNLPTNMPLSDNTELVELQDESGAKVLVEHKDPEVIQQLLQGMRDAQPSYIGDPEPKGTLYRITLVSGEEKLTYAINDLSRTNALTESIKLYDMPRNGEGTKAWLVPTAWFQLLMDARTNHNEPEIAAIPDEDSDRVILIANRDIDQQSVEASIASTLMVNSGQDNPQVKFTIQATDPRRMVVQFPDPPQGVVVRFKVEGAKSVDGHQFRARLQEDGELLITIHLGLAWSGLRWLDTTGAVVHEHGFDSARFIEPSRNEDGNERELMIYNQDNSVYRLPLEEEGEIEDVTIRDWPISQDTGKYNSEYGINTIYSYSDDHANLYVAQGLQTIYKVNPEEGTKQPIYMSDRPIYGIASSPDGKHVAILVDVEHLGAAADLIVIDAKGKVVSKFAKAASTGHSDGFHFIYPVRWTNNSTIEVPWINAKRETIQYDYKKGLLSKADNVKLPEDARQLLEEKIGKREDTSIIRVLQKPGDREGRYYAVFVADGIGSCLIDLQEKKVILLGSGALMAWTPVGQVVVWHSTEGKNADFIG